MIIIAIGRSRLVGANLSEWIVQWLPYPYHLLTVVCLFLPTPTNGVIFYSDTILGDGTVATYTCDTGYTLNGGSTRTCGSNGMWSGFAPSCQRKWNGLCTVCLLSVLSPIQLTALNYLHWPMG